MTTPWRKSSRSQGNQQSNCVELRLVEGGFQVRDSKLGDESPIFDLTLTDFENLKRAAR
ncbi:DUF397 domain-containing protein [Glycomyces salinus]|uniref:DUF397 domain-containing protein n=1 Tax=Glycomyces salinus TaxID=980294 RepID=UPI0018EA3A6A|nr:DUF397 domain-containing protein [Glycomyces salinus]